MCDSWEGVKAVCGPPPAGHLLSTGPQSPTRTAVWQNSNHPKNFSPARKPGHDRCVDTGQVMAGHAATTIVSRKMLSADDPACTVVVVQSHPYESGSDMRTRSSAAARRTVHCTDTFCRAERAHQQRGREREGGAESTFCSAAAAVCAPSRHHSSPAGQTKLLLE